MGDRFVRSARSRRRRGARALTGFLLACSLLGTMACGGSRSEPTTPTVTDGDTPRVTGEQARALVAGGAVLLDVSPADRFPTTRIEGAINIPITELEARMGELPRDRPVVVYCGGGRASPRAASTLRRAGYDARLLGARSNW